MKTVGAVEDAYRAYEAWGASRTFLDDMKSTGSVTLPTLKDFLASIESTISRTDHRLLPVVQGDGPVRALPRARSWVWGSLAQALKNAESRSVVSMLPPLWQMEPLVFAACREVGAPLCMIEPDNFAVAARAIDTAGTDAVIATARAAHDLALDLTAHGDTHPSTWFIIRLPDEASAGTAAFANSSRVISEIHLIPGVPLLVQCEILSSTPPEVTYHCAEELRLAFEQDRVLVSVRDANLMPLHRVELPISIREAGTCACGKTAISLC